MEKQWEIKFNEYGGYDCMTAGTTVGPACLDGAQYGQPTNGICMTEEQKAQMLADARLIAASHDLLAALETLVKKYVQDADAGSDWMHYNPELEDHVIAARSAIAKARGA